MAVDRDLWLGTFDPEYPPKFPCPRCSGGVLSFREDTFNLKEPQHSIDASADEYWDRDWEDFRFVGMFECKNPDCRQLIAVSGDTVYVEVMDEDEEIGPVMGLARHAQIRTVFPALHIFRISKDVPLDVAEQMKLVFQLFWVNHNSCAAALRTALEMTLDSLKIPRFRYDDKGSHEINLNARIQVLSEVHKNYAGTAHALRIVGNWGAHGDEIYRDLLFDAFDLFEDALNEFFEAANRRAFLRALEEKILEDANRRNAAKRSKKPT